MLICLCLKNGGWIILKSSSWNMEDERKKKEGEKREWKT